jgi:Cysteine-rich CPCC
VTSGYPCPCCGFLTLDQRPPGTFLICPVCFWEDDNVQAEDPEYSRGANAVSLQQARENFRQFGAVEARFSGSVRSPRPDEIPERSHP